MSIDETGLPEEALPADMENVMRMYRGNFAGVLAFDENVRPLRYVMTDDGHLIAPVMVAVLSSLNTVLFTPEEDEDALQVLVTPEELGGMDYCSAETDRWRVYHGEPKDVRWARLWVESLKLGPVVFDGETIALPNPFTEHEPRLCRVMNDRRDDLRKLAKNMVGVEIPEPVMVGTDPWGINIRARFGVVRVNFPAKLESADEFLPAVENMLSKN